MKVITVLLLSSALLTYAFEHKGSLTSNRNIILIRGGSDAVVKKSKKKTKNKGSKKKQAAVQLEASFEIDAASLNVYVEKLKEVIQKIMFILKRMFGLVSERLADEIREKADDTSTSKITAPRSSKRSKKSKSSKKTVTDIPRKSSKKAKQSIGKSSTNTTTENHLKSDLSMTSPNYRIQKELKNFMKAPPENLSVKVGKNIRVWIITLTGAKNTIYEGEKYRLRVEFPTNYPMSPPSMYFLQPTPKHEHVYTNGDICLSLLGKDWRPTMTAQSVAISILSILSSAQSKELPQDNAAHSLNKPGQAQNNWVYHDDNC